MQAVIPLTHPGRNLLTMQVNHRNNEAVMELKLAVLADYANVSSDGKLNSIGVFSEVNPKTLPAVLPHMYLVLVYAAAAVEGGLKRVVQVVLADEDGKELMKIQQEIAVPKPKSPARRIQINQILGMGGVTFAKAGDYQFSILIGDDLKETVAFRVNKPPKATRKGKGGKVK